MYKKCKKLLLSKNYFVNSLQISLGILIIDFFCIRKDKLINFCLIIKKKIFKIIR